MCVKTAIKKLIARQLYILLLLNYDKLNLRPYGAIQILLLLLLLRARVITVVQQLVSLT